MADNEAPLSPDLLLRRAAAGDAARALDLLASVSSSKLLDAVLMQAELAVDDDRPRTAGIDAIAELDRAAIEVMDLPQSAHVAVDVDGLADDIHVGPSEGSSTPPTLVGWELVTIQPDDLETAAMTLDARPWQIALVAFEDSIDRDNVRFRRVVAAAADGRVIGGQLRFSRKDDGPDVLDGVVSRSTRDLADDAPLATGLLAALRLAARGA